MKDFTDGIGHGASFPANFNDATFEVTFDDLVASAGRWLVCFSEDGKDHRPEPFFLPSASPLGLRPPKSGRPAPNSPISSLSDCGFQPERTETARDLTKNPAVIEDTYTAVGTMQQLQDASRIIGLLRLWHDG